MGCDTCDIATAAQKVVATPAISNILGIGRRLTCLDTFLPHHREPRMDRRIRVLRGLFAACFSTSALAQSMGVRPDPGSMPPAPRPYQRGLLIVPDADGRRLGYYVNEKLIGIKAMTGDDSSSPSPAPSPKPSPSPSGGRCGDLECPPPLPPPPPPPPCPMPCITFSYHQDAHFLTPRVKIKEFPEDISPLLPPPAPSSPNP